MRSNCLLDEGRRQNPCFMDRALWLASKSANISIYNFCKICHVFKITTVTSHTLYRLTFNFAIVNIALV